MRLAIFGPPGSGKGTQSTRLANSYNLTIISTGDLIREAIAAGTPCGREAESYVRHGELVPGKVVRELANQAIAKQGYSEFILDGYPRTLEQAGWLSEYLKSYNARLQCVVSLMVPDEILVSRLSRRRLHRETGQIYHLDYSPPPPDIPPEEIIQRLDDHPEAILIRLETYRAETFPVEDYYRRKGILIEIDGTGDVESIQSRIVKHVDRFSTLMPA